MTTISHSSQFDDNTAALYNHHSQYQGHQLYPCQVLQAPDHDSNSQLTGQETHTSEISHAPDSYQETLPWVGQTRCYWTLLNSSLQFLVIDPVLAYHLQEQAPLFYHRNLLDFVHPEERDSAQKDLGNVVGERTLNGTVTRVRYCRLSRVRSLLGHVPSASNPPYPSTFPAERIAIDSHYMAVDIVINWVAEGVVLCFLHAVVDIEPGDNDEQNKTGWSNWCSTYGFGEQQASDVYRQLYAYVTPSHVPSPPDLSFRVFQILRNEQSRTLVLSWPPDSTCQSAYFVPTASDLSRLAQHVDIGTTTNGNKEARTSCMRRYKSTQNVPIATSQGVKSMHIESIFIVHGTVIFACHKIDPKYYPISAIGGSRAQHAHEQSTIYTYNPPDEAPVTSNDESAFALAYVTDTRQQLSSQAYVQQWVEGQSQHPYTNAQYAQWLSVNAQGDAHTPSPELPPTNVHLRGDSGSNGLTSNEYNNYQHWMDQDQSNSLLDTPASIVASTSYARAHSPTCTTTEQLRVPTPAISLGDGSVEIVVDDSSNTTQRSASKLSMKGRRSPVGKVRSSSRDHYSGGGRSAGNPPIGVAKCARCKATHSPEWRKGPSGKKDLCNACGLRFARSRAKKDGVAVRKRKEKEKTPPHSMAASKHTPTTSMSISDTASGSSLSPSTQSFMRSHQASETSLSNASSTEKASPYMNQRFMAQQSFSPKSTRNQHNSSSAQPHSPPASPSTLAFQSSSQSFVPTHNTPYITHPAPYYPDSQTSGQHSPRIQDHYKVSNHNIMAVSPAMAQLELSPQLDARLIPNGRQIHYEHDYNRSYGRTREREFSHERTLPHPLSSIPAYDSRIPARHPPTARASYSTRTDDNNGYSP